MLLSRVADSLYWIGRYLERAEQTARLVDVRLDLGLDRRPAGWDFERLYAIAKVEAPEPLPTNPSTLVDALMFDAKKRDSVLACVNFARDNARQVREEISSEIPCRYVSGYLFQLGDKAERSLDGATHAWLEAWLLDLGWVGFDPTHNILTDEHYIRVAVGRDYADVPPTRGVFKGQSAVRSELAVGVSVGTTQVFSNPTAFVPWMSSEAPVPLADQDQQQQQQ